MAKRPDLVDITSITNSSTIGAINQNWDRIQEAFDNTVSLDGSVPNAMNGDLDINGNALLNVGTIDTENLTLNGQQITDLASVPEWRSAWVTATSYVKNDLVKTAGNVYICLVAHTSGTFATDLTALKWELMVPKGDSGAGTGDMVAANNLSDVADPATARSNLSLGTVATENTVPIAKGGTGATDAATALSNLGAQPAGDTLDSLEGLALVSGDTLYATGADTLARLPIGSTSQVYSVVGGVPAWSNRGYVWFTPQATTSGTTFDFTGIPTWATEVILLLQRVKQTAGIIAVQLRVGGSPVTSGYIGISGTLDGTNSNTSGSTSGFGLWPSTAGYGLIGAMTFTKWPTSNLWVATHTGARNAVSDGTLHGGGDVTLAGALDGIRLIISGGTANQGNVVVGYR